MSALDDYRQASDSPLHGLRCILPLPLRKLIVPLCWRRHDARDFIAEDVEPSASATGVPARPIGQRRCDLTYDFRKFLG